MSPTDGMCCVESEHSCNAAQETSRQNQIKDDFMASWPDIRWG